MRFSPTIAAKLVVAYGLFLAPIAYLGHQVLSDEATNIAFPRRKSVESATSPRFAMCRMRSSVAVPCWLDRTHQSQ